MLGSHLFLGTVCRDTGTSVRTNSVNHLDMGRRLHLEHSLCQRFHFLVVHNFSFNHQPFEFKLAVDGLIDRMFINKAGQHLCRLAHCTDYSAKSVGSGADRSPQGLASGRERGHVNTPIVGCGDMPNRPKASVQVGVPHIIE